MRVFLLLILLAAHGCAQQDTVVSFLTYHLVPPDSEFSGLVNKNTGDVKGDIQYATKTMHECTGKANGRCMDAQVLESVFVTVKLTGGKWGKYTFCNLQANISKYVCCDQTAPHPAHPPCPPLKSCEVGRQAKANGGYWYSFPECGQGTTWTTPQATKRINASCVGNMWRTTAGGCATWPKSGGKKCTEALDECVQYCVTNKTTMDQRVIDWYNATSDGTSCPQLPGPQPAPSLLPTPAPTPSELRYSCGAHGTCVKATSGHASQSKCTATCHTPTDSTRFICGGLGECIQYRTGHVSIDKCQASCPG